MSHIPTLRTTCLLAAVRFTTLGVRKVSDGAIQHRLPGADEIHKRIISAQHQARQIIISRSIPSGEDAWRIVPQVLFNPMLLALTNKTDGPKAQIDKAVAELREKADGIIEAARANGATDVPTRDELVSAYTMQTEFKPLPNPEDFLLLEGLPGERLKQRLETKLQSVLDESVGYLMRQLITPLETFVERMEAYNEREAQVEQGKEVSRAGAFRDTAVTRVSEMAAMLPHLNITQNEPLQEIGTTLRAFTEVTPKEVRKDAEKRAYLCKAAIAASTLIRREVQGGEQQAA